MSEPTGAVNLAAVLAQLKSYGLLERAAFVKAGDVEVQLGPPMQRDADPTKPVTPQEEADEVNRVMYGATRGLVPGVM